MNVSDFTTHADVRLKKLTDLLAQMYGLQIDWDTPESYLESVLSHYEERKALVLSEGATSSEYTKSVLIAEAIRIFLKEIAPNRKKKSRRK